MNRQQLLSRLGKWHSIIYTSGVLSRWDIGSREWSNATWVGRFEEHDAIIEDRPPKLGLQWKAMPALDRAFLRLGARRWRRRLERNQRAPVVAYIFHPAYWEYVSALSPDFVVFHPYDQFSKQPAWNSKLSAFQAKLLACADLIVTPSLLLSRELEATAKREVKTVPNAVDFELYSSWQSASGRNSYEPADLGAIPHPRIGYTGNINRKVDLDLIARLSKRHEDWNFVFVGRLGNLDPDGERALAECRALGNVYFLGEKKHTELPAYLCGMDVNIMCYRIADDLWTRFIYPLKLHEYLAVGRPVIGAALDVFNDFRAVLTVASGVDGWEQALHDALSGKGAGTPESRREVAKVNTWDQRAEQLNAYLMEMLQDRSSSAHRKMPD